MKRIVHYFNKYGPENTEAVIDAVAERLGDSDLSTVVVASTSGRTALKFAQKIRTERVRIICVSDPPQADSYPGITPKRRKLLETMGVLIIDRVPYASTAYSSGASENIYGALDLRVLFFDAFRIVGGNGLKVAIEVGLMAADGGIVEPGEWLITVGGTEKGADTAIVMKAAFSQNLLAKDPAKRPEVYEILAMPTTKKWWW